VEIAGTGSYLIFDANKFFPETSQKLLECKISYLKTVFRNDLNVPSCDVRCIFFSVEQKNTCKLRSCLSSTSNETTLKLWKQGACKLSVWSLVVKIRPRWKRLFFVKSCFAHRVRHCYSYKLQDSQKHLFPQKQFLGFPAWPPHGIESWQQSSQSETVSRLRRTFKMSAYFNGWVKLVWTAVTCLGCSVARLRDRSPVR